ncbi:MAG: RNA polymerase sigma factor [Planctomycetota bacterium]
MGPAFLEDEVGQHGKRVYTLAYRVTRNHHDAEDIFQEVFLRIWKRREAFRRLDRPDSWVYRVTLNLALDTVDRRKKSPAGKDVEMLGNDAMERETSESPEGRAIHKELRTLLRRSADRLPRAQREVFVLRNDEGLSYREISAVLECPEERARANFYQAMKHLRKTMQEAQA